MPSLAELLGLAPPSAPWSSYLAPSSGSGTPWWLQATGLQPNAPFAGPLAASPDVAPRIAPDIANGGWLGGVLAARNAARSPTSGGILQGAVPDMSQDAVRATASAPLTGAFTSGFGVIDPLTAFGLPAGASAMPPRSDGSLPWPSQDAGKLDASTGSCAPWRSVQVSVDPWQAPIFEPPNMSPLGWSIAPGRDGRTTSAGAAQAPPTAVADADPPRSALADFFESIPRGFLSGLADTASASGQAAQIEMQQPVDVPSADSATDILEQNVTGPLPRPQGTAGQYGATVGGFLGNPGSYLFPGGIGAKLATAVTGALGSEAAGQLTKGTWAEPFARIGGAVLGGGLGASALQRGAAAAESAANAVRRLGPEGAAMPRQSPASVVSPTGQMHHAISRKVYSALEDHPNLKGLYVYRDRRFETQAIDLAAHKGYETWHRQLDDEIANHIRRDSTMTPQQFEDYLRSRYARPDLLARFPKGL